MARPKPWPAPVTSTVLSSNEIFIPVISSKENYRDIPTFLYLYRCIHPIETSRQADIHDRTAGPERGCQKQKNDQLENHVDE